MSSPPSRREIPIYQRHRAYRAAYYNGFFWGVGQGLLNSMMIRYLLIDLCKTQPKGLALEGMVVAWAIAAPRLAGFFRFFTAMMIDRFGSRKWYCIIGLLIAPVVVGLIPLLTPVFAKSDSLNSVLLLIIGIWFLYHLVEYLAMVAFWSWVGDLVPNRVRGRFFAWRETWLIGGMLIGVFVATKLLPALLPVAKDAPVWERYLAPAALGCLFKIISALPLVQMPEIAWRRRTACRWGERFGQMFAPAKNWRFMLLIAFVCWINMANGLTQTTQTAYNYRLFPGEQYGVIILFTMLTRAGQLMISPPTGRLIDRFGNVKIIAASMVLVSTGSLCYFAATPDTRYFLALAAVAWVFWLGVNIGTLNMAIGLAQPDEKTSYIAFYFAVTTGMLAVATLLGGALADHFRETQFVVPVIGSVWNYAQLSFVLSWFLRLISIAWLLPFLFFPVISASTQSPS